MVFVGPPLDRKDVRFVQLYHTGWDQHDNLPAQIKRQAEDVDQGTAALIMDLKQRGLFRRHSGDLGWRIWPNQLLSRGD